MKKKTIVTTAVVAALVLSVGCVTVFAAESDAFSYLIGQQRSTERNEAYEQAAELPEDEQDAFLAENGIGETPWSEEAAASYSYVSGQRRGASYRQNDDGQDDDEDSAPDMSGYSYLTGQQRGASYHK